jgi:hypothetical protein
MSLTESIDRVNRSRERFDRFVDAKAAREHQLWAREERARADELDAERVAQLEQARRQVDACRKH